MNQWWRTTLKNRMPGKLGLGSGLLYRIGVGLRLGLGLWSSLEVDADAIDKEEADPHGVEAGRREAERQ